MKVLFLSPEAAPFAKTGGLADVAGSLPGALKNLGLDVRLGLPYYRAVKEGAFSTRPLVRGLEVPLGQAKLTANVLQAQTGDGIPVYLFEREDLFERPNLYGTSAGDYYDNLERFAFFGQAALLLAKELDVDFDVVHCHDWQTGLVPVYLKTLLKKDALFEHTASLFTIHNIGYQGLYPKEKLATCGLPLEEFHPEGLEYWKEISLLKAGIVYSDAITTVSPKYSREIQTPEFGMGMEGVLKKRSKDLYGILNGADYSVWDPARDSHLKAPYSPEKMVGKGRCKEALIREMGLDSSLQNMPLLGIVSRLDAQKGLDLLVDILDDLLALGAGLVVLGSGEERVQQAIQKAAERYPGKVGLYIGFNEPLAHRIIAGTDMFLIPSRYEPCGLTQMYALKYGTVPVVRATGGLDDTIVPFDAKNKKGNGFKFGPYKAKAFLGAIQRALRVFKYLDSWKMVVANGMKEDFSWDRSARKYAELYESLASPRASRSVTGEAAMSRVESSPLPAGASEGGGEERGDRHEP
jgi:starch synthase